MRPAPATDTGSHEDGVAGSDDRRATLVVLRALGLGDLLTVVPALRALAQAYPRHRRVLATTAPMVALARSWDLLDEVVSVAPLAPLPPALRHCEVAVNLHGSGPESHRVLQALAPRRLVAFASVTAGTDGPAWRAAEHEVTRWCRLLQESGVPADPSALDVDPPDVAAPDVAAGSTVVHPGAAFAARRWPVERWAAVVASEHARGHRVVLTGGPDEVALCRDLAARAAVPDDHVLAGRTDVLQLAATVAVSARVVCADTGVAHLATALGRPSVVLFGPVPPSEWGPPPARARHRALWAGRRGDPLGEALDPGLDALTITDVVDALRSLPESDVPPAVAPAGEARSAT